MYGLPALGSAASAKPITDIWDVSTTPPTTPPPTTPPPTTPPPGSANLARGKPTTTSSAESSTYAGAKAVDGSASTRWASKEGSDPQWISVDLGADTALSRVQLKWEAAYGKSYKIQTSTDGSTWTSAYSTTTGNGGTDDLAVSGHGRYVRMSGTQRGTAYGYSLYEFEVYGAGASTPPATPPTTPPTTPPAGSGADLTDPHKKEIAMELVSSAENSSLDWKGQYTYIEDIGDGRGYTAGIVGFCSGTGDMLDLVRHYTDLKPGNVLAPYLPALEKVNGSASHTGLGAAFESAWTTAAKDTVFQRAQDDERDRVYFDPAVGQAKSDGLHALGQFAYYDAIVMHGPGDDSTSFGGIRKTAMQKAKTPAQGGNETTYLNAFLDARKAAMLTEAAHEDTTRVDTEQRVFLNNGNLDLNPPLQWKVYGDPYAIND
ncbi:chitosanase [Streptomyces beijiangensis]